MRGRQGCIRVNARLTRRISEAAENLSIELIEDLVGRVGLLGGQEEAARKLRAFVAEALAAHDNNESLIAVIIGEWGLGKTFLYNVVRRAAEENGLIASYVSAGQLIDMVQKLCSQGATPLEAFETVLAENLAGKPTIVFLDEFEWLIGRRDEEIVGRKVIDAFIDFLKALRSGGVERLRGKLHLVVASTPTAFQILLSVLKQYGYHGWLVRREHIIRIQPASKLDAIRLAQSVIEKSIGRSIGEVVEDPRVLEVFHLLSLGNPGALVSLVNKTMGFLQASCSNNCLCRASPRLVLEAFYSLKLGGVHGAPILVSTEKLRSLLGKGYAAELAALSALVYEDEEHYAVLREQLGDSLVHGLAYILGGDDAVEKLIGKAVRRLSRKVDDEYSARTAISQFIHLTREGSYAFFLPADREEIARRLLLVGATTVSVEDIEVLRDDVEAEAIEVKKASTLPLSALMELYPAVAPRTSIDFMPKPEEAAEVLREAQRLLYNNPALFEELSSRILAEILERIGVVYRDPVSQKAQLVYKEGDVEARAEVRIAVIVTDVENRIKEVTRSCDETEVCIIFYPELSAYKGAESRWNVFALEARPLDLQLLAALGITREKGYYIDEAKLGEYMDKIASSYGLREVAAKWAERALSEGVLVPHRLLGLERITKQSRMREIEFFKNGYYMLLVGGREVDVADLADKLLKLYRVRPYHKGGTWCDIPIPPFLALDVEPEDTAGILDYERTRQRILEKLYTILDIAIENRMAIRIDSGKARLELHPVEKRLLRILSSRKEASFRDLRRSFILYKSVNEGSEAYSEQVLRTLISILERRGLVKRVVAKKSRRLLDEKIVLVEKESSKARMDAIEEYKGFIEAARGLRSVPGGAYSPLLHVAIAKAKGWKLVTLKDMVEAIEELKKSMESSRDIQPAIALKEVARAARLITEKFLRPAADHAIQVIEFSRGSLGEAEKLAEKLRAYRGKKVFNIAEALALLVEEELASLRHLHSLLSEKITAVDIEDVLELGRELLGSPHQRKRLAENFWYDKGCNSGSYFNLLLYRLYALDKGKGISAKIREKLDGLRRLEELLDRLEGLLAREELNDHAIKTSLEEAAKAIKASRDVKAAIKVLDSLVDTISERIEEASRRRVEEARLRDKLDSILRRVEATKQLVSDTMRSLETLSKGLLVDARELESEAAKLLAEAEGLEEELKTAIGSLEAVKDVESLVEKVTMIEEAARGIERKFSGLASVITTYLEESLEKLREEFRVACSLAGDECLKVFDAAKKLVEDMNSIVRRVKKELKIGLIEGYQARYNELERIVSGLKNLAVLRLGDKTMLAVYKLVSELGGAEARLHEVVEQASKKLGLRPAEVVEALVRLDRNGLARVLVRIEGY